MTLLLTEGLVDALVALLQAQVPAKVAELNTRYGDSLLVAPRTDAYHIAPKDLEEAGEFPACFVLGKSFRWSGLNMQSGANVVVHRVSIVWVAIHGDTAKLQRTLMRLALGTLEILRTNQVSGGGLANGYQLGAGVAPACDLSGIEPAVEAWLADAKLELAFVRNEVF